MTFLGEHITASDLILNGILTLVGLTLAWSLLRLQRSNGRFQNFNLAFLIMSRDGYPDGAKCIELGVFLLMSWAFVVQVTKGSLQEWFLIAYVGAFVTRGAFGAYLRSKNDPAEPGTKVTTEVVTTAKTTEVHPDKP